MSTEVVRTSPLNVLVALADIDPNYTSMIAGLRGHYALVCVDPVSAINAVENGFSPDVAIIDTRLPNAADLAKQITEFTKTDGLICIALCPSPDVEVPNAFAHRLNYPAVGGDLAQLFWWLSGGLSEIRGFRDVEQKRRQIS